MRKPRKEKSKERRKRWSRKFLEVGLYFQPKICVQMFLHFLCSIFWMLSFLKLNIPKFMIWHPSPFPPAQGRGYKCPIQTAAAISQRLWFLSSSDSHSVIYTSNAGVPVQALSCYLLPGSASPSGVPSKRHFYWTAWLAFIWASSLPQISLNIPAWNLHARCQTCPGVSLV